MESLKIDLFDDTVYVFLQKRRIRIAQRFPVHDFCLRVHTEVGLAVPGLGKWPHCSIGLSA